MFVGQWKRISVLRLRVVIPHFYREGSSEGKGGYGSGRFGNRLPRSVALARCLEGALSLNRAERDWILNLAEQQIELSSPSSLPGLSTVKVELHLFVTGDSWLHEIVELFSNRLILHELNLKDPRQLPLTVVRNLLDMPEPADLAIYLEDDLVIQDSHYVDKLSWFYQQTNHRFVLMPHRREFCVANAPQSLYVDGPIKEKGLEEAIFAGSETEVASGRFWDGQDVIFCKASNPHSGSFCLSAPQLAKLRSSQWPPSSFVGPLETAATGTVLGQFPVLKTSWACREFLSLQHGNPSFLGLLSTLPKRMIS